MPAPDQQPGDVERREVTVHRFHAGRRGVLAYEAYLGHVQLVVRMRDALPPRGPALDAYLDTVLAALSTPPP